MQKWQKKLSIHLGTDIKFVSPNLLSFFLTKRKEKLPTMLILVMIMLHYFPRFQKAPETTEWVEKIIHRPATTFEQFINRNKGLLFAPILALFLMAGLPVYAQNANEKSEIEQISETLLDYIEGTANGEPDRLKKAFHPDFNLYTVTKDSLWIRDGEQYISNIKVGEKANRIGRIISIDYEKDAAIAKAEIIVPDWRIFTDYFLLLKYEGSWKIVQKSYTWKTISKK